MIIYYNYFEIVLLSNYHLLSSSYFVGTVNFRWQPKLCSRFLFGDSLSDNQILTYFIN